MLGRSVSRGLISCAVVGMSFFAAAVNAAAQQADLAVIDFKLANSQRITRTVYQYAYTAVVQNAPAAACEFGTGSVSSTATETKVVDSSFEFGPIASGGTADSSDTFAIQQDRTQPFNPSALVFQVQCGNHRPIANAGQNQSVSLGSTVNLNGAGSTDADGDALTFAWTLVPPAGSTASLSDPTSVMPTFVADVAGSYTAKLVVNDGKVNSAPVSVVISTVNTPPQCPDFQNRTVGVGVLVNLDFTGCFDPDGTAVTHSSSLSKPAGSLAQLNDTTSATPSFTPDIAGVYEVTVVVSDGLLSSTPKTVTITAEATEPPNSQADGRRGCRSESDRQFTGDAGRKRFFGS